MGQGPFRVKKDGQKIADLRNSVTLGVRVCLMDELKPATDVERYRDLDAEILGAVRDGNHREGARLFVEAYGAEILGTCINRMSDVALGEDAAQDALVRGIRGLPGYRGQAGLRPWLHRIAANRCVDLMRKRQAQVKKRVDESSLDAVATGVQDSPLELAEAQVTRLERLARVRAAMAEVKEPDRTWLELHYTHGLTYDTIADEAGLSRAAVKQRIWRAVKKVRALLVKWGEETS